MVTKYNTASPAAPGAQTSGGSNAIPILIGVGLAIWLGYEFWYKPTYILPKQQQK